MIRERVINIGIVVLLAIISVASPICSQPAKQFVTSATFSEPVLGIQRPEVLGVFQPFAGCRYGYPMEPVVDATRMVGYNIFDASGIWISLGKYFATPPIEKSAFLVREVTAYQVWRVMVPREYTVSFPVAYIGVDDYRDLAGNSGKAILLRVELDRTSPVGQSIKTE
jgi:hypothetical protein